MSKVCICLRMLGCKNHRSSEKCSRAHDIESLRPQKCNNGDECSVHRCAYYHTGRETKQEYFRNWCYSIKGMSLIHQEGLEAEDVLKYFMKRERARINKARTKTPSISSWTEVGTGTHHATYVAPPVVDTSGSENSPIPKWCAQAAKRADGVGGEPRVMLTPASPTMTPASPAMTLVHRGIYKKTAPRRNTLTVNGRTRDELCVIIQICAGLSDPVKLKMEYDHDAKPVYVMLARNVDAETIAEIFAACEETGFAQSPVVKYN